MRSLPLLATACLAAALAGCQPQMFARGSLGVSSGAFVTEAPTPVIRANVSVQISFFGVPLAGAQDVVFVLDRSGSMSGVTAGFAPSDLGMSKTGAALTGLGVALVNMKTHSLPTKMEAAKQELVHTLSAMPDGTRFMIIFFDENVTAFTPYMATLDPPTREAAIHFIQGISAGGSTAAVPALRLAYKAGAARVVLLSDGLANEGGDGNDLLADARGAIQGGVRFDTVGVGLDQDGPLLSTLAAESGGIAVKR